MLTLLSDVLPLLLYTLLLLSMGLELSNPVRLSDETKMAAFLRTADRCLNLSGREL